MTVFAFANYLAQTTLAVSVLIALVLLVRRPFARHFGAKAAYALWAIPVLRLVLPPMPSNWTLLGWLQAPPTAPVQEFVPLIPSATPELPAITADFSFTPASTFTTLTEQPSFSLAEMLQTASPLILGLWALGACGTLALTLLRQRSTAALIDRESHAPSQSLSTLARQTRHGLGIGKDALDVKTSLISSGPLVTGLWKPTVLLPEWFEADYTYTEQKFALTHEMMHIKRGDLWALHVAAFAMALQWFNPLAWIALKAFRTDQEAACDADVLTLKNTCPHAYGATLVKAARISRPAAQPIQAASLPLNHALHERLTTMKNPLPSARQRLTGSLLTASVGAAALLASACAVSASAQETTTDDKSVFSDKSGIVTIETDGKTRKMVLLSDPFEGLEDLGNAVSKLDIHVEGLDELVAGLDVELAALDGLTIAGESMALLTNFGDEQLGNEIAKFTTEMTTLIAGGNFDEDAIEALAEDFESRMETWSENFEISMEAQSKDWEESFETRIEALAETVEARAESLASNIEAQSERIEAQVEEIERAGETVEELADQCESNSGIRIVTVRKDGDGQTQNHKAICLDHNSPEDATAVLNELQNNGDLTPEELATVEGALKRAETGNKEVKIRIRKETETSE